jgi:predicted metal-dependent phosphoesterase TrpH
VIDLHTHSTVSDGSDSPERIPELAAEAGCTAVALTDHDRQDGVPAAAARAAELGVRLVPGCEISCEHPGTMHVLVYFLEPGEGPLQDELVRLQEIRDARNRKMAELMASLGLPVTYDEIQAEAGGKGAGRPHIAAILVRKGVVDSVQEAFDVWLAKGKPAYMDKERLSPERALELARASGALPVLAHPLSLGLEPPELESTVAELAGLGLVGVEAIYGRYAYEDWEALAQLAGRHGLAVTGGSDHHGTYKPDLRVGVGRGDLNVPDRFLAELEARRG